MKKRKPVILDPVLGELRTAIDYYESKSRGLGLRFYESFEEAIMTIAANADGFEQKYKNYRQIRLKKFPFILVFEVRASTVPVSKLIHVGRHPGKRYSKKK